MIPGLVGQPRASALIAQLLKERAGGRTVIFEGPRGSGKFTAALAFAEACLGRNPFLSADFTFFRNDDFGLKTRYFLHKGDLRYDLPQMERYFHYLCARLSLAFAYDKSFKPAAKLQRFRKGTEKEKGAFKPEDFRADFEQALLNEELSSLLYGNEAFREDLEAISDDLSRKQAIPIDFIRALIDFHSRRSGSDYRVSVIGGFENATEEAQNSSLKLFEEPPATSLLVLTVDNLSRVLPTILSRAIVVRFSGLSPHSVAEILPGAGDIPSKSTVEAMENAVYDFRAKQQTAVRDFFTVVAPKVGNSDAHFQFIEALSNDPSGDMPARFLEELTEFLRGLHLARQSLLRGVDTGAPGCYADIYAALAPNVTSAELRTLAAETAELHRRVRYGNITETTVLPSLLVNLARWMVVKGRR